MTFFVKYWRYLSVLLLCLASYAGGRFSVPEKDKTTTSEHSIETSKTETVETNKTTARVDKVTTITKKKDGTEITQIVDHSVVTEDKLSKTEAEKSLTVDKKTETIKPAQTDPYRPSYRVGVEVHNEVSLTWDPKYRVEAGYRVLGNLWTTGSYDIGHKEVGIGVSVDF